MNDAVMGLAWAVALVSHGLLACGRPGAGFALALVADALLAGTHAAAGVWPTVAATAAFAAVHAWGLWRCCRSGDRGVDCGGEPGAEREEA